MPAHGGGGLEPGLHSAGAAIGRGGGAPNPLQPHLRARTGERTARDLGRVAPRKIPRRMEAQVLPSCRDTRGVGLGWVVACTGGGLPRSVCLSLTGSTGPYPGCLVSQPPRLLMTPEPHQGAGGREMLPCLCVCACWGPGVGGLSRQGHTFVVLQRTVVGACGGLCVPGALGPSSGAWAPYHKAAEGVCGSGDRQLSPAHN